jgi:hypothetical protein
LTSAAAEIALTSPVTEGLSMIDAGLPPVTETGPGDRIRRSVARARPRRIYRDVIAATAPVDIAAPIISPVRKRPSGPEGEPGSEEAVTYV